MATTDSEPDAVPHRMDQPAVAIEPDRSPAKTEQGDQATLHFIQSSQHRVVHGDGVWGGPTPQGNIAIGFFSERGTTPQKVIHTVSEGKLGEDIDRKVDRGFVRELDFTVLVSPATAHYIADWLKTQLKAIGWISE